MSLTLITGWQYTQQQTVLGWYHIMWLVIMVVASVLVSFFLGRKHNDKTDRIFVFTMGAILLVFEIYKQIFLSKVRGHFDPTLFPFQFCSVPMWVAVVAPLLPWKKVRESMYLFLATCGLLAGLATISYPAGCLRDAYPYITMLIHTMYWHAAMVVMGVYLIVSRRYMTNIKSIIKELGPAILWLVFFVVVANATNIIHYNVKGFDLNFMYISPYGGCEIPVLAYFRSLSPIGEMGFFYWLFFIMYIVAFLLGIAVIWFATYGINCLVRTIKSKKA